MENIISALMDDLEDVWLRKIERCCALEYHDLIQRGQLTFTQPEDNLRLFIETIADPIQAYNLIKKYPILALQLELFVQHYIHNTLELLQRLIVDYPEIIANYCSGKTVKLTHIAYKGDAHNQHRRVASLTFSDELQSWRIIYKPRSIENEDTYNQFLHWVNQRSPLYLKTILCINKTEYGWCEYVENMPCQNAEALQKYYERFGALIAISYVLNISDLHYENLIASGDQPILIDLECMGIPSFDKVTNFKTVQDTGLLPHYTVDRHGIMDISALGGGLQQETPCENILMVGLETGEPAFERQRARLLQQKNRPLLEGDTIAPNPEQYLDEILRGFDAMYGIFLSHKNELLQFIDSLFVHNQTRLIVRRTSDYIQLLSESYHPALLHRKKKYQQYMQWVQRHSVYDASVSDSEYTQLMQGDVPAFYIHLREKICNDAYGKTISLTVYKTGYENLVRTINRLSVQDHKLQKQMICMTLVAKKLNDAPTPLVSKPYCFLQDLNPQNLKDKALENASAILEHLWDSHDTHDFFVWPLHHNDRIDQKHFWYVTSTKMDLYSGLAGILLPFAYAAKLFNHAGYQQWVIQGLKQIETYLASLTEPHLMNFSLFGGISGILYLCTKLHALSPSYPIDNILKSLAHLYEHYFLNWLDSSYQFDVIGGSAGIMLALHASKSLSYIGQQTNTYLTHCSNHILQHYPNPKKLPKQAHNSYYQRSLLGVSHGVSGMAWSLYKACDGAVNQRELQWIRKALAYEREHFSQEHQDWPNFIDNQCQADWCHGACGIGISRLDMRRLGWRDEMINDEIDIALQTIMASDLNKAINLCHGSLALMEFLWLANQQSILDDAQYNYFFHKMVTQTSSLHHLPTEQIAEIFIPGLMTGRAGVAYQLMRLACPAEVPSILLLE